jgi:hypothetical protein
MTATELLVRLNSCPDFRRKTKQGIDEASMNFQYFSDDFKLDGKCEKY